VTIRKGGRTYWTYYTTRKEAEAIKEKMG